MSSQGKGGGGEKQGGGKTSKDPVRNPSKTETGKVGSAQGNGKQGQQQGQQRGPSKTETGKVGSAQGNGKQGQQQGQQRGQSKTVDVKGNQAQGTGGKIARQEQPLKQQDSSRITKAANAKNENASPSPVQQGRESESKEKEEEEEEKEEVEEKALSKELQTLAKELSIMEGSSQEIIEAACREIRNSKETMSKDQMKRKAKDLESSLEELKKVVFSVKTLKENEHDFKKTKTKILDFHRCQEDLTVIKTAVMNPNKSNSFKSTQTVAEVEERINALHIVCKKMETDQKRICEEVLGKNEQPSMEEVLKAVQSLKKAAGESKTEIQQQKTKLEQMEKKIVELMDQLTDSGKKHQALLKRNQEREQKLTDEINEVKSQKEKALTRLSEVAGAKLTESNPYITDLSDPNRPEKIGEQFSELYDNLWTDVFEKLSGTCKLSERDSIQTLLQILEDSYGYCKDISSKRYSNTLAELTLWKFVEPNETPSQIHEPKKEMKNTPKKKKGADTKETTVNITLDELQKLQTLLGSPSSSSPADSKAVDSILAKIGLNVTNLSNIKKMLKSSLEGTSVIVQESFWKQRSEDPNGQKEVLKCTKPFLMKCVHICWLMVGQDPPVYLRFSDKCKDKFNKDIYREYTTNGEVLDFVVWPAIFLHENGPLLKKGVAQPISKK